MRGLPPLSSGKGARPTCPPFPGPTRGSGTFLLCAVRVQARLGAAQMQHFLPTSLVGWEEGATSVLLSTGHTPHRSLSPCPSPGERGPPWVTMFSSASRKLEDASGMCRAGGLTEAKGHSRSFRKTKQPTPELLVFGWKG